MPLFLRPLLTERIGSMDEFLDTMITRGSITSIRTELVPTRVQNAHFNHPEYYGKFSIAYPRGRFVQFVSNHGSINGLETVPDHDKKVILQAYHAMIVALRSGILVYNQQPPIHVFLPPDIFTSTSPEGPPTGITTVFGSPAYHSILDQVINGLNRENHLVMYGTMGE